MTQCLQASHKSQTDRVEWGDSKVTKRHFKPLYIPPPNISVVLSVATPSLFLEEYLISWSGCGEVVPKFCYCNSWAWAMNQSLHHLERWCWTIVQFVCYNGISKSPGIWNIMSFFLLNVMRDLLLSVRTTSLMKHSPVGLGTNLTIGMTVMLQINCNTKTDWRPLYVYIFVFVFCSVCLKNCYFIIRLRLFPFSGIFLMLIVAVLSI